MGVGKFSTYKPGNYEYMITGTVGTEETLSINLNFILVLKDLCIEDVTMSLTTTPFSD
jgi:membrane carboxypeptidase/penicillin-binding protein PbpC